MYITICYIKGFIPRRKYEVAHFRKFVEKFDERNGSSPILSYILVRDSYVQIISESWKARQVYRTTSVSASHDKCIESKWNICQFFSFNKSVSFPTHHVSLSVSFKLKHWKWNFIPRISLQLLDIYILGTRAPNYITKSPDFLSEQALKKFVLQYSSMRMINRFLHTRRRRWLIESECSRVVNPDSRKTAFAPFLTGISPETAGIFDRDNQYRKKKKERKQARFSGAGGLRIVSNFFSATMAGN